MLINFILGINAHTFDITKLNCSRRDHQNDQDFISEIHFHLPNMTSNRQSESLLKTSFEGEVLSYSIQNNVKKFISGYNLFSISFDQNIITGFTGDPMNHTDGSFSLSRISQGNNGKWMFSLTPISSQSIQAEFFCTYGKKRAQSINN